MRFETKTRLKNNQYQKMKSAKEFLKGVSVVAGSKVRKNFTIPQAAHIVAITIVITDILNHKNNTNIKKQS